MRLHPRLCIAERPVSHRKTMRFVARNRPFCVAETPLRLTAWVSAACAGKASGVRNRNFFYPESVVRLHSGFVLLPDRLLPAFVEDVAGYIEKKREASRRQQCGRWVKSQQKVLYV